MDDLEIYNRMQEIVDVPQFSLVFGSNDEMAQKVAAHQSWLRSIRHERPSTETHYNIGIYIRYFNQTKYENYLSYHKKQFRDTVALCPNWELVDFYIDEGANAPNMENAPEWSRLVQDCFDKKVELIITQKVSNVSRKMPEVTLLARLLAAQKRPVGIYFISEDIFTMASYYQDDLRDSFFLPGPEVGLLPDDNDGE